MPIKTIKLSQKSKDTLIKVKRITKISNWNTLCRIAFCLSIAEKTPPPPVDIISDSNVEMSWETFGGKYSEIYWLLLLQRCKQDNLDLQDDIISQQFKLHLYRGIGYLAAMKYGNIFELLSIIQEPPNNN
jgi:DNA sulfur modification protein DndE